MQRLVARSEGQVTGTVLLFLASFVAVANRTGRHDHSFEPRWLAPARADMAELFLNCSPCRPDWLQLVTVSCFSAAHTQAAGAAAVCAPTSPGVDRLQRLKPFYRFIVLLDRRVSYGLSALFCAYFCRHLTFTRVWQLSYQHMGVSCGSWTMCLFFGTC